MRRNGVECAQSFDTRVAPATRGLALVLTASLLSGCFTTAGAYAGYRQAKWKNEERDEMAKRGEPVEPPVDWKMSAAAAGTVGLMLDLALLALVIQSDTI